MTLPNFRPPVFSTLGCRLNAYETEAMKVALLLTSKATVQHLI